MHITKVDIAVFCDTQLLHISTVLPSLLMYFEVINFQNLLWILTSDGVQLMIALTTSSERRSTIKCGLIGINETFSPRRRVLGFETQEF